jgi:hypothetical protein
MISASLELFSSISGAYEEGIKPSKLKEAVLLHDNSKLSPLFLYRYQFFHIWPLLRKDGSEERFSSSSELMMIVVYSCLIKQYCINFPHNNERKKRLSRRPSIFV